LARVGRSVGAARRCSEERHVVEIELALVLARPSLRGGPLERDQVLAARDNNVESGVRQPHRQRRRAQLGPRRRPPQLIGVGPDIDRAGRRQQREVRAVGECSGIGRIDAEQLGVDPAQARPQFGQRGTEAREVRRLARDDDVSTSCVVRTCP
jgi:hypothetical protein